MKLPHRRQFLHLAAGAAVLPAVQPMTPAAAQSGPPSTREVPARSIPVPDTVSPQMQAVIARPFNPNFNLVPETTIDGRRGSMTRRAMSWRHCRDCVRRWASV